MTVYIERVSEYGLFHDLRIVGIKPSISMVVKRSIEMIGCSAISQIGIAQRASMRNTISIGLISFVPYLILKRKIAKNMNARRRVIHPPIPAPPFIWSAKIIPVVIEKINHEKR